MRKGLDPTRNGIVAGLDVGCSKVCCFIARADDGVLPRVVGIGQQASHGVKGGVVGDMAAVEAPVRNAVPARSASRSRSTVTRSATPTCAAPSPRAGRYRA